MRLRSAAALAALAIAAMGGASVSAKREVLQLNDQLLAAIRARDTATLMALTASDFEADGHDGPMRRQQWCAAVVAGKIVAADRAKTSVTVERSGHVGICGQHHPLRGGETEFCDDWEKRNGRWQLISSLPQVIAL